MHSLSINSRLVIVFLSAVLARVVFHHITGFIADDAFITFRYARNLAAGLGFVYNQGEPVMGTSTPLIIDNSMAAQRHTSILEQYEVPSEANLERQL